MGAKFNNGILLSLVAAAAAFLPACSSLKRFAPPGFVKYEDRGSDQPVNPVIKERVATQRARDDARFPDLSKEPSKRPDQPSSEVRTAESQALIDAGALLDSEIEQARAAARLDQERGVLLPGDPEAGERSLDETSSALSQAVETSSEAARLERAEPLLREGDEKKDGDEGN